MNAIEIRNLSKNFGEKLAVNNLNLTVPSGAIYGFIGENGSGKSTTEKIICGLIPKTNGTILLYGKDYKDQSIREKIGMLIEAPGCFPNLSVFDNLMIQAENLSLKDSKNEVIKILKLVRMEGAAKNKFKNCSLGMKQRVGIAMALLGDPLLLVLDEPLNGLDADGTRIMREVLIDLVKDKKRSIIISSHLLPELQKIATHYGIIRNGQMIVELTADELSQKCPEYVALKSNDIDKSKALLSKKFFRVNIDEEGYIRIYDAQSPCEVVNYLYQNDIYVNEIKTSKIDLEEYYIDLMKDGDK